MSENVHFEVRLTESAELGDPVIWRYMSFIKFQDLLHKRCLFFANKSLFPDYLEGSFGDDHIPVQIAMSQSVAAPPDGGGPSIEDEDDGIVAQRTIVQHHTSQRMRAVGVEHAAIGINCWTCDDKESVALWKSFAGENKGVVIRSTLTKFREALSPDDASETYVGCERYVETRPVGLTDTPYRSLLYKSHWYDYEKEIRFMKRYGVQEADSALAGVDVAMDLDTLIDQVVVHPMSSDRFLDIVRTCMEKASLSPDVVSTSAIRKTASRLN